MFVLVISEHQTKLVVGRSMVRPSQQRYAIAMTASAQWCP